MSLMIGAVVIVIIVAGAAFLCLVSLVQRILHRAKHKRKRKRRKRNCRSTGKSRIC